MSLRVPEYSGGELRWAWTDEPSNLEEYDSSNQVDEVCITLEIPQERILVSDFDAWGTHAFCSMAPW